MKWIHNNGIYNVVDSGTEIQESLPKAIYHLQYNYDTNQCYLLKLGDSFVFNHKLYGVESNLIDRIVKTYNNTTNDLGMLFSGLKGTGKTVTAKIIANKLNIPIILVDEPYPGMGIFLSAITNPCIIFLDEFEKTFNDRKEDDLDILKLMDGTFTNSNRKVFIITCNQTNINDNYIARPSRIRYHKKFGNLSTEIVNEIIEDCLINKNFTDEVKELLRMLNILTIDIVRSIIDEVNIHDRVDIEEMVNSFNAYWSKNEYYCFLYCNDKCNDLSDFKKKLKENYKDGCYIDSDDGAYVDWIYSHKNIKDLKPGDIIDRRYVKGNKVVRPLDKDNIFAYIDDDGDLTWALFIKEREFPNLYDKF